MDIGVCILKLDGHWSRDQMKDSVVILQIPRVSVFKVAQAPGLRDDECLEEGPRGQCGESTGHVGKGGVM